MCLHQRQLERNLGALVSFAADLHSRIRAIEYGETLSNILHADTASGHLQSLPIVSVLHGPFMLHGG